MGLKDRIEFIIKENCLGKRSVFAEQIKAHETTIGKWDDNRFPNGDILNRIRQAFNVDINWFLTGQGEPYIKDRKEAGPPQTRDKTGLWGKTDHIEVEGKPHTVTTFSPDESSGQSYDVTLVVAAEMLSEILKSNDNVYIHAIMSNLIAFSTAVKTTKEQNDRINRLEAECIELRNKLLTLEKKFAEIEKIRVDNSDNKERAVAGT